MLLNTLLASFWLILLPIIIGSGILKLGKQNIKISLALMIGLFCEFAIFEFFAIPYTLLGLTFYTLRNTWLIVVLVFVVMSIIKLAEGHFFTKELLDKNHINKVKNKLKDTINKLPKTLVIIFLILLFFQCYMGYNYKHEDADDSNMVAKAVIAVDTNSLFKYDDEGNELTSIPMRNGLSPFFWFTGCIATLSNVHSTIMAHTIFPVIFVLIAYNVYYLIATTLFKDNLKKQFIFLIILSVLYIFGNYTRYSIFVRLLTRIWQGKSILATITIPFIFYLFLEYIGKENDNFYWFVLMISLWGSILLTSMSLSLPIIISGLLTFLYMIKDKKLRYILKLAIAYIPSICYGIIYLIIK
jgi:hypothetical protein